MVFRLLVTLLIVNHGSIAGLELPFGKIVKIERFQRCPEHPHLPIYFEKITIYPIKRYIYLSGRLVSLRNNMPELKLVLECEKCKSKENLDSCEVYRAIQLKNMCQYRNSKQHAWSPIVSASEPPIGCPPEKGTYVFQNGSVDALAVAALPIGDSYWRVRAKIYEERQGEPLVMCTYVEGQLVNA